MKRIIGICLLALVAIPVQAQYDNYGGWLKLQGKKTGFFHTEQIDGRWWLVTPEGNVFISKGVCEVTPAWHRRARPMPQDEWKKWAQHTVEQLKGWNFNTISVDEGRPLPGMAYVVILNLAAAQQPNVWRDGIVLDYFSPQFQQAVEQEAAKLCRPLANDSWLIGYYPDSELKWFPDIRGTDTVLQSFLKKPTTSPGYQRAVAFLKERGHTPATMTEEDKLAFLEYAAAQYGKVCVAAIRRNDPNHSILGMRFNEHAPIPLSRGLGPYFDVLSMDIYEYRAPLYKLGEMNRLSGKPTLITEFSFKAMDSGNPNTVGAGESVMTQQDRAGLFAAYVEDLANLPSCVGYHWFAYRDEPKQSSGTSPGGFGAENSNYGLVQFDGTPWTLLTRRMTEENGAVEALHSKSRTQ
jgi:agarase